MSDKITLIHTADLHLGRKFTDLGAAGKRLRSRLVRALERAVAEALSSDVDLFVVAGDLFDGANPPREAVRAALSAFERLHAASVRSVVMPGTHDPPGSKAMAARALADAPGVILLTPEHAHARIEELDLAICAWFPSQERDGEWTRPPGDWSRGARFRLAMAHGASFSPSDRPPPDLIPDALLKDAGLHYIALGHFHGAGPVETAASPSWYSGAPEVWAMGQRDGGHVLRVTIEAGGDRAETKVERVQVGSLSFKKIEIDAAELSAGRDLEKELARLADGDLILDVEIGGSAGPDAEAPDLEELARRFGDMFFRLRLADRAARTDFSEAMKNAPENSVTAQYMDRCREMIAASDGEERAEWEEALTLGLSYLRGSDQGS